MNKQTPEPESAEFKDFRNLAKNLLAVPKKEIDKKRAAHENKKHDKKEKPAK